MTISSNFYMFQARDGYRIDGDYTLNTESKAEKLIIMLPGLTGMPQQFMFMALRDRLVNKGYDIFIAGIYSSEELNGASKRSLLAVNMQRHVNDFKDIVAHFKDKYKNIYAIGHSLSGRTLLLANEDALTKQVLLDPSGSFENGTAQKRGQYYKKLPGTTFEYIDWGDGLFILTGEVFKELLTTPFKVFQEAVKNLRVPSLFIAAGKTEIATGYKEIMNEMTEYKKIEGAGHCFFEYGIVDALTLDVLNFFEK